MKVTSIAKLPPRQISFDKDFELLDGLIAQKDWVEARRQEHYIFFRALKFIAEGANQSKEIAAEVIKTLERKFKR